LSKEELKVKFSTGKKPTGADFAELIDELFNKSTPNDLDVTKKALIEVIAKKVDAEDFEALSEEFVTLSESTVGFLTEEDVTPLLEGFAKSVDIYTKEEVDLAIKNATDDINEEINLLKDEISALKGEEPTPEEPEVDGE